MNLDEWNSIINDSMENSLQTIVDANNFLLRNDVDPGQEAIARSNLAVAYVGHALVFSIRMLAWVMSNKGEPK